MSAADAPLLTSCCRICRQWFPHAPAKRRRVLCGRKSCALAAHREAQRKYWQSLGEIPQASLVLRPGGVRDGP